MFQKIRNFLAKVAVKFLEWLGFEVIIKQKPPLPPPEIEEEIIPEEELEEEEMKEITEYNRYQWIFYFSYVSSSKPYWNRKLEVIVEFNIPSEDPEDYWDLAEKYATLCLEEKNFPTDIMDEIKNGVVFIDRDNYPSNIEVEINDLKRGYKWFCEFPRPTGLL